MAVKEKKGWSQIIQLPVNFMTGNELNDLRQTNDFSYYSLYALVEWPSGLTNHVKIDNLSSCDRTVDEKCILEYSGSFKGQDLGDKEWGICLSDPCIPAFSEYSLDDPAKKRKPDSDFSISPQTTLGLGWISLLLGFAFVGIGSWILEDNNIYKKSSIGERTATLSPTGEAMVGFFAVGGVFLAASPVFFIMGGNTSEWSHPQKDASTKSEPKRPPVYGLNIAGKF